MNITDAIKTESFALYLQDPRLEAPTKPEHHAAGITVGHEAVDLDSARAALAENQA